MPTHLLTTAKQFFRYGVTSIVTYSFIIVGTYVLTDIFAVKANVSYFFIMVVNYIVVYALNLAWTFQSELTKRSVILFTAHVVFFFIFNNIFFNLLYHFTELHYLLITVINIILFAPVRFLSLKFFVFPKHGN